MKIFKGIPGFTQSKIPTYDIRQGVIPIQCFHFPASAANMTSNPPFFTI